MTPEERFELIADEVEPYLDERMTKQVIVEHIRQAIAEEREGCALTAEWFDGARIAKAIRLRGKE